MTSTDIPIDFDAAVAALATRMTGEVLVPGSAGYDRARAAWNVAVQQHPVLVVVAETVADVADAVRFARDNDLPVAVQATGHGIARAADGAVLIVTARLDAVTIDASAATAYVSAGAQWGPVLAAAQQHGLAPLLGSSPVVGAVGYTLGGGMGWLARRHGLASDSVRAFDLVTPAGQQVRASAEQHPDLYWSLKGAGAGTFGVVTGMEIDLYPVTTVYAGNLLYPADQAHAVLARWREWIKGVDDDLTSSVCLMNFPPFDDVPEPIRGQSFAIFRGCYAGDPEHGAALVDEWRAWQEPLLDLFGPLPFTEIATVSNDPVDPLPAMTTCELFDSLPDEAVDEVVRATFPGGMPLVLFSEFRHCGGAIARNAPGAPNNRARTSEMVLEMVGITPEPEVANALDGLLHNVRAVLAPYATGAVYLNFVEGAERQGRTPDAFSDDHLSRLRAVKAEVDGDDRFSHGLGITPA
jgi:hypothetical protein